jgi:hypothetical protein
MGLFFDPDATEIGMKKQWPGQKWPGQKKSNFALDIRKLRSFQVRMHR